jgi:hypothetical protein
MKMEVLPGQLLLLLLFVERMTLCFLEGSELIFYLSWEEKEGKGANGTGGLLHWVSYQRVLRVMNRFWILILQGYVFIDRDGKHFRHILNWLRDGVVPTLTDAGYSELMREAEYYQLLVCDYFPFLLVLFWLLPLLPFPFLVLRVLPILWRTVHEVQASCWVALHFW